MRLLSVGVELAVVVWRRAFAGLKSIARLSRWADTHSVYSLQKAYNIIGEPVVL